MSGDDTFAGWAQRVAGAAAHLQAQIDAAGMGDPRQADHERVRSVLLRLLDQLDRDVGGLRDGPLSDLRREAITVLEETRR